MKALNIAMVAACPFPANRGTPSRILRMSEALARLGHNVHVVTYHSSWKPLVVKKTKFTCQVKLISR